MKKSLALLFLLFFNFIISQQDTTDLKEVIVSTTKLEIPFSKNFRTVKIISSEILFLPLALLLANTFLPLGVDILSLNPCLLRLFLFEG